jgi:hypothetical protein
MKLFDILPLLRTGSLDENTRKAFLVYALSHPRPLSELLDPRQQPLEQLFQTEFSGMTRELEPCRFARSCAAASGGALEAAQH